MNMSRRPQPRGLWGQGGSQCVQRKARQVGRNKKTDDGQDEIQAARERNAKAGAALWQGREPACNQR